MSIHCVKVFSKEVDWCKVGRSRKICWGRPQQIQQTVKKTFLLLQYSVKSQAQQHHTRKCRHSSEDPVQLNHAKPTPGQQVHNEHQVRIAMSCFICKNTKTKRIWHKATTVFWNSEGMSTAHSLRTGKKKRGITMAPVLRMAITAAPSMTITMANCIS